jgi:hypothetical protein
MRPLRLARIAAEAEVLRLRHRARRTAVRATLAIIATAFLIAAVGFVHVAAWFWLRQSWDGKYVALTLAGADLVVAALLGVLAMRAAPSQIELEALAVRERALEGATAAITWSTIAVQSLRILNNLLARSRKSG